MAPRLDGKPKRGLAKEPGHHVGVGASDALGPMQALVVSQNACTRLECGFYVMLGAVHNKECAPAEPSSNPNASEVDHRFFQCPVAGFEQGRHARALGLL